MISWLDCSMGASHSIHQLTLFSDINFRVRIVLLFFGLLSLKSAAARDTIESLDLEAVASMMILYRLSSSSMALLDCMRVIDVSR